jgi:hypothetical protein
MSAHLLEVLGDLASRSGALHELDRGGIERRHGGASDVLATMLNGVRSWF